MRIKLRRIPKRWIMATVGMLGVMMSCVIRNCMGLTLTQMVNPVVDSQKTVVNHDYCPMLESMRNLTSSNRTTVVLDNKWFDWDEKTQGEVLSAFYYGYLLTHLPAGMLCQKFGGKRTMGFGVLSTGIFTLMTPFVARIGSTSLSVLRFAEGLGQGVMFPALCTILAQWAPPEEMGRISTLVFSGVQIGNSLANLSSGFIIQYVPGGWPNVFYIFGIITILWFILWCVYVYDDPNSHPYVSDEERDYLQRSIGSLERKKDLVSTPWKDILTSRPVWALIIVEIGTDWGGYTIVSDLPKYMSDVLHFTVTENGFLTSIISFFKWIMSILFSILADRLINRRAMSVTQVRIVFTIIGSVGPGILVMCASFVGCNKLMASLCFTLGMALMGILYPGFRVNSLDLSPNYSSIIMSLQNGIGCLSGMATPYVTGILTPNRTVLEWRLVFWIMMVVMTTTSIVYGLYGTGERQQWDELDRVYLIEEEKEKSELPMEELKTTNQKQ